MSTPPLPSGHDIYWEKWLDAFESSMEPPQSFSAEDSEEEWTQSDTPWEAGESAGFDNEEEMMEQFMPIKGVMTPYGMLPITDDTLASRKFKFWVGHANFRLTEDYYNVIGATKGVETLDILTPYRFRIAVGKMFIDRDVMSSVRDRMVFHVGEKSNRPKK